MNEVNIIFSNFQMLRLGDFLETISKDTILIMEKTHINESSKTPFNTYLLKSEIPEEFRVYTIDPYIGRSDFNDDIIKICKGTGANVINFHYLLKEDFYKIYPIKSEIHFNHYFDYVNTFGKFLTTNDPEIEIKNLEDYKKGIYTAMKSLWPTTFSTIDITIVDERTDGNWVLMGKKHKELSGDKWRFLGGFIDPTDRTSKESAVRELWEESNIKVNIEKLKFLDQVKINDSRYLGSEHGIMTSFYYVNYKDCDVREMKASDDIALIEFIKIDSNFMNKIIPNHKILGEILIKKLKK